MTEPPEAELDPRFSSSGAGPTSWDDALGQLESARVWWITTVRPEGRPHVTPLLAVWQDEALHFCTGPGEQKARNLAKNPSCALTTGANIEEGLDVVVEGVAERVTDDGQLQRLADAWVSKYGPDWQFDVRNGAFVHGAESLGGTEPAEAHVFAVAPAAVFAFGKGDTYSQTVWHFGQR